MDSELKSRSFCCRLCLRLQIERAVRKAREEFRLIGYFSPLLILSGAFDLEPQAKTVASAKALATPRGGSKSSRRPLLSLRLGGS